MSLTHVSAANKYANLYLYFSHSKVVTNFLCRVTDSAHLVVGPSLSLDE